MNQVGVSMEGAGGADRVIRGGGRGNEVEKRDGDPEERRTKEERRRDRGFCFGGVNILELVSLVQKVTANISVCLWDFILFLL